MQWRGAVAGCQRIWLKGDFVWRHWLCSGGLVVVSLPVLYPVGSFT